MLAYILHNGDNKRTHKPISPGGEKGGIMKKGRRSKLIIMAVSLSLSLSLSVMSVVSQNRDVMAQTVKVSKVTKVKKSKVIDGFKFISKKNNYEGCYRKISWKKIKGVKGYQVCR